MFLVIVLRWKCTHSSFHEALKFGTCSASTQKRADQRDLRPIDKRQNRSAPLALIIPSTVWVFLLPKARECVLKAAIFIISTETLEGPLQWGVFAGVLPDPFATSLPLGYSKGQGN